MQTRISEYSYVSSVKSQHCLVHHEFCRFHSIGSECRKYSSSLHMKEPSLKLERVIQCRTAQDCYDIHNAFVAEGCKLLQNVYGTAPTTNAFETGSFKALEMPELKEPEG